MPLPHPTTPAPDRAARPPVARLDVARLGPVVQDLFTAGLAASTRRAYQSGSNRYGKFCQGASLTPYPATEEGLLLFIAHLHEAKLAHGTIKSYLAAIRYEQIRRGWDNPQIHSMPWVEYVLKGVKATPVSSRRRLPITPAILLAMKRVWQAEANGRNAKMLWAACCLCFCGFLRSGEITCPTEDSFDPRSNLSIANVKVDNRHTPTAIQVTIKSLKTDPFRQVGDLHIGVATGPPCPVAAVLSYMVARGNTPGPLFIWEDGRCLTRERFVAGVRAALEAAGYVANDYAGHSFRIGAATTAAQCGIQDYLIKTLGRWESSAYTRYIRTSPEVLRGVAKTLTGASN